MLKNALAATENKIGLKPVYRLRKNTNSEKVCIEYRGMKVSRGNKQNSKYIPNGDKQNVRKATIG